MEHVHEYDAALKAVFRTSAEAILRQLFGGTVVDWLSAEFPKVQTLRADLLGLTAAGKLIHIELQSTNDPQMALRILEYAMPIFRRYGKFARQIVLYTGEAPLRMPSRLINDEGGFQFSKFECSLIDIRELDGEAMLASEHIGENVLAILTKLQDQRGAIRAILGNISKLSEDERRSALLNFW